MPDKRRRTAFGLALFVGVGLSYACDGWRDPITGHRVCRAAPAAIESWSRTQFGRRPGDHADLEAWATSHPDAVNAQYGGSCETPLHRAAQAVRQRRIRPKVRLQETAASPIKVLVNTCL
jgi:hypothetical protein